MNKYFYILIVLIGFSMQDNAQVKIGLIGGINFSDANQKQLFFYNPDPEIKQAFGGIIDFYAGKNSSFRLEPQYIEKGTSNGFINIDEISTNVFLELSYIELPVLICYSIGRELRPYLFAGPEIGINTVSNIGVEAGLINVSIDADNFVNDFELSFVFGGGISYRADELLTIFLEAKYVFGLTNILKNGKREVNFGNTHDYVLIPDGTEYKNRGIQIMFGFTFPLMSE